MTIIWCGGEDIDFSEKSRYWNTGSTYTRTAYTRVAFLNADSGFYGRTYSEYFEEIQEAWGSMRVYHQVNSSDANSLFLTFNSSTCRMGLGARSGYYAVGYWTSALGWNWFDTSPSAFVAARKYKYDIYIKYGVSGVIRGYADGNLVASYSGDITVSGETGFTRLVASTNRYNYGTFSSEMIVATEDTRLMSLKTLAPNAVGDTNEWSGEYTDIDEITLNDEDYINTGEEGKIFTTNLTGMPAGEYIVKAVFVNGRVTRGLDNYRTQLGIKTNGVLISGEVKDSESVWVNDTLSFQINPVTGQPFTPTEVDNLQIFAKSVIVE